jgi:hypothetical protein
VIADAAMHNFTVRHTLSSNLVSNVAPTTALKRDDHEQFLL